MNNLKFVSDWLEQQTDHTIRIITDDAPGYGNQAASANLILRLRESGFSGPIEFIYPGEIETKIKQLFGLSEFSESSDITFYTVEELLKRFQNGTLKPVKLALTGGLDVGSIERESLSTLTPEIINSPKFNLDDSQRDKDILYNYANILNADIFVLFSQYQGNDQHNLDTSFHLQDKPKPIFQTDSSKKYVTSPPQTSLLEVEKLLQKKAGKQLIQSKPGLKTLIDAYKNKNINFIPSYGHRLAAYSVTYINEIVAGAAYAQLHGSNNPMIIPVFYDFDQNRMDEILAFIQYQQAPATVKAFRELALAKRVSISSLNDPDASEKIQNVKSGEILILVTGKLPNTIFNALYGYTAANIITHVREGASSLIALIQNGKPHIRCGGAWEFNLDINELGETTFNQMLQMNGICDTPVDWSILNIPELIGNYILDAQNPDSGLSKYFKRLQKTVMDPKNDRIAAGLRGGIDIFTNINAAMVDSIESKQASSTAQALLGLMTANVVTKIIDTSQRAMIAAPTENENPEIDEITQTLDIGTWLVIAAASFTVLTALIVLARRVNWNEKFNYYREAFTQTFYANEANQDIENQIDDELLSRTSLMYKFE